MFKKRRQCVYCAGAIPQAVSFANTRWTKNGPCRIKLAGHRRDMRGRPQEVLCSAYFVSYNGTGALYGNNRVSLFQLSFVYNVDLHVYWTKMGCSMINDQSSVIIRSRTAS